LRLVTLEQRSRRPVHYPAWLDGIGANVLNGYDAYRLELSEAAQCALFASLGVRHPLTRAAFGLTNSGVAKLEVRAACRASTATSTELRRQAQRGRHHDHLTPSRQKR
jgi:hypothetical protein